MKTVTEVIGVSRSNLIERRTAAEKVRMVEETFEPGHGVKKTAAAAAVAAEGRADGAEPM
jgi:transposase-like protein